MRLILIRHGETSWNRERRIQGCRSNTELSQRGREQAEKLASRLRNQKLDAVYSSPLMRAVDTAQAIARTHGLKVSVDADLREIDAGELDGLSEQDLLSRYKDLWTEWRQGHAALHLPGGESLEELQNRTWGAIERIMGANPHGTVAAIGHLVANSVIICRVLGLDLHNMQRLRQDPTAITILELGREGNSLLLFNDTCHLGTPLK